ncbi:MAG: porin family protein [Acidiferrobacteraceae bacterium]
MVNRKAVFSMIITSSMLMSAQTVFAQSWNGSSAGGSRWSGPYIGARVGVNDAAFSDVSGSSTYTGGLEAGYLTNLNGPVVGLDGFVDLNPNNTHAPDVNFGSRVYGVDLILGLDNGPFMPYAKVGYAQIHGTGALTGTGSGFHGGLGVEYMVYHNVGVDGQWTYDRANLDGGTLKNNNFTVGANLHF